jgi:hypothetical protein
MSLAAEGPPIRAFQGGADLRDDDEQHAMGVGRAAGGLDFGRPPQPAEIVFSGQRVLETSQRAEVSRLDEPIGDLQGNGIRGYV